jgi:bifunctional non-homologous end joining protein LigD
MLASLGGARLDDPGFVYEPKYDGIRAIVEIGARGKQVTLWSRLGNDKTRQFPEIAGALEKWAKPLTEPVVLDGEIVALDSHGDPTGFQQLQGRIHLTSADSTRPAGPVAFIAFDLLKKGAVDFRGRPLLERREALEKTFGRTGSPILRISEIARGDGRPLHERALASGWEGLIAKLAKSRYISGKRTPDWRKVKIVQEQEFVVGGWTEPRNSRLYFGALLLGVYEGRRLVYAGHVGTGFDEKELARLFKLLKPLEVESSPFASRPPSNEKPHWVRPNLVAQVRFTEWTADNILRHPVYLGLRDDKKVTDVKREQAAKVPGSRFQVQGSGSGSGSEVRGSGSASATRTSNPEPRTRTRTLNPEPGTRNLIEQLRFLEDARRDAVLTLPGDQHLKVGNLHKVFWPKLKLTKGDLMRYYVEAAPFILPAVADRPLVMKRFPNGIDAPQFYQHRALDVPRGVRTEVVTYGGDTRPQMVGGDLLTLLYMAQLAAISQDPWFSRVQSPDEADYVAIDLDPMPDVPFSQVLDVARWVRDELKSLGAVGFPKTSGADGLHIYIPLQPGTPYEAGMLFCQIVATVVAQKHPKQATVERMVKNRGKHVYVDYLQNIPGKTLATAYSARASEYAGVSTPLTWREVDEGVDREAFTIRTAPERLKRAGDLWAGLRKSKGVDLSRATRYGATR